MNKKNLIIILIDGARLDFTEKSNTFKKLNGKSVFFSQMITYAPYTTAAMHATLSGCYGNRTGVNSYWDTYEFKNNNFLTLADYLGENSYYTYADSPFEVIIPKYGFDEFNIHDEQKTDLIEWHTELLDRMKKVNDDGEKFFLYLHYSKIHVGVSNDVLKVFNNFSKEYFENKDQNFERYSKLFKDAEVYFESIFQKIVNLNLLENSIVLILSDHGTSIGEKIGERAYGAFCYDYTLKTFAYLINSDISPKKISSQIRHIDLMPTVLDMLDIPINSSFEEFDGQSLMPLINGQEMKENFAFSETGNPLSNSAPPKKPNTKSIRTSKWKLIYNEYNETKELYDLENDPNEENNLSGKNLEIENVLLKEISKYTKINS
jgi:arylsulfatase A-like enzyme